MAATVLAAIPTPYYLISPGQPTDLATVIAVDRLVASDARFFSTGVNVQPMHALFVFDALWPATQIVPKSFVIPAGQTDAQFDATSARAMEDSQHMAAFVAERAAGYPIEQPPLSMTVTGFSPSSLATPALRVGDHLLAVNDRSVRSLMDVGPAIAGIRPGEIVQARFERDGKMQTIAFPLSRAEDGSALLGLFLQQDVQLARMPIPVHFDDVHAVGSSAGLMFALQIYADLKHLRASNPIAGTGTLLIDGTVRQIRGTRQKVEAARRVGARVFFVPSENYADVRNERGIEIVPITSFAQAVRYLEAHPS